MAVPLPPPPGLQPHEPPWQTRVLNPNGQVCGGAVLVSPHLAVTCAHVVATALRLPRHVAEHPGDDAFVALRSFDGRTWEARVGTELWAAGPGSRDLALLRLTASGTPDTGFPVLANCSELPLESGLRATGYPALMDSLQAPLLYRGKGGPTGFTHQVEIAAQSEVRITEGFSGCAVRAQTGEVVGILQKNHHYPWKQPEEPTTLGFVLPVEEMLGSRVLRDTRSAVTVQRLVDESLCGEETYDSLHDLLASVTLDEVPTRGLLDSSEVREVRRRTSGEATAWTVFTALLDLVAPYGGPPRHVSWVHHVYQELLPRRPIPLVVGQWIRRTASVLGPDWEEILIRDRERRRGDRAVGAGAAPTGEPSSGPPSASGSLAVPETVVVFDLAPAARGYRLSHSIAHLGDAGYEVFPQGEQQADEEQICDLVGDIMSEASLQRLVVPTEESLRLRVLLPRELLHLNVAEARMHREMAGLAPSLGTQYEIVYHIRERTESKDDVTVPPERWARRSERQREKPCLDDRNVLIAWRTPGDEIADALADHNITVCVVDSDHAHIRTIYNAIVYQGVPTIIRGPRHAVTELVDELLSRKPGDRVEVTALARYLRDRARMRARFSETVQTHLIALIHDDHGDDMIPQIISSSTT